MFRRWGELKDGEARGKSRDVDKERSVSKDVWRGRGRRTTGMTTMLAGVSSITTTSRHVRPINSTIAAVFLIE